MAKNKILTILAAVAVLLVVILTAGLIVSVAKDKTDKPVIDNNPTEEVKVSGKVYGDDGNELEAGETYAMPTAMVFSMLYDEPLASQLKLASPSVNVTVAHNFPYNNIKVDWAALYSDGSDASSAIKVTPTADGSTTAKVECLSAFAQPITLKVNVRGDKDNSATCTVDYVKRFTGMENFGMTGTDFDDSAGVDFYATFSQGTVMPDIYLDSATFYLKDDFTNAVKSYLTFDIELTPYKMQNVKGVISEVNGKQCVTCEPGGGYSWAGFINGFNNLDDEHKKAIYYAWFHAWEERNSADRLLMITVDITISATYRGNSFGGVSESEFIGNGYLYLSGEQYGMDLTPSLSLNRNIAF